MSDFVLSRLASHDCHLAYPLIREAVPGATLRNWQSYIRRTATQRRFPMEAAIAARRRGGRYPVGLFCYRRDNDVEHGAVLTADHVIAIDILDPHPLLQALLQEMDSIAAELRCSAVRSHVHHGASDITNSLIAAGHRIEGAMTFKPLLHSLRQGPAAPR